MIHTIKYTPRYKKNLEKCMEGLQEYLVSIDSFKQLTRPPGYGKKYVKELLKTIIANKGVIFLAEDGGEIVGCIAGIIHISPLSERLGHKKKTIAARVLELYVDPAYRGKRIGGRLMKDLERYFKQKKCKQIRVEVYAPNSHAHEFYQAQGYKNESIDLVKKL